MSRISFDQAFMETAYVQAKRSTCERLHVGACVVSNNIIVSTGYNGAPRGMAHCSDVGCLRDASGSCQRIVHAEVNALLRAGSKAEGATIYVTHYPCARCWPIIINAGVTGVIYDVLYGNLLPDYEKMIAVGQWVDGRAIWRGRIDEQSYGIALHRNTSNHA